MKTRRHLTEEECEALFRKYETPPHVIRHCRAVSRTAGKLADALNASGACFDAELVRSAGLIHDVMRLQEPHGPNAADMLESIGFPEEADIVRVHMIHLFPPLAEAKEVDLVCLADRLVKEDRYVGLDERVEYLIHKKGESPERTARLLEGKKMTRLFMDEIEKAIGQDLDILLAEDDPEKDAVR